MKSSLDDLTEKSNESSNALLWMFVIKTTRSGTGIVEIAAYLVAIIFNEGYIFMLKIAENFKIRIGHTADEYRVREVKRRIAAVEL